MYARLMGYYLWQQLKVEWAHRANLVVGLLGQLFFTALSLTFIGSFLPRGAAVNGWDFWQILFLVGLGDVTFGLNGIFVFRTFAGLNSLYILQGRLDQVLTQPTPALFTLILHNLNVVDLLIVLKGLAILVVAVAHLELGWSLGLAGKLLLIMAAGSITYGGILLSLASTGFWLKRKDSAVTALLSLNQLCQYPLALYPMALQFFLSFLLPVAFASFYPAQWILKKGGEGGLSMPLAAILAASILCAGLAGMIFHAGLKRYSGAGS